MQTIRIQWINSNYEFTKRKLSKV